MKIEITQITGDGYPFPEPVKTKTEVLINLSKDEYDALKNKVQEYNTTFGAQDEVIDYIKAVLSASRF